MTTKQSLRKRSFTPRGETFVKHVLDVTRTQLSQHGFNALCIPDIAEAAGVHKTSIYRRWPTKTELVRDALHEAMGHHAALPDTGDIRSDILILAERALQFVQSTMGRGILRTLLADGEQQSLVAGMLESTHAQGPQAVLKRAIERGQLPKDTPIELVLSVLAGTLLHRTLIEQSCVTQNQLAALVDLVLFGILQPVPNQSFYIVSPPR